MNKLILTLLAVTSLGATSAFAKDSGRILIADGISCGQWVDDRREPTSPQSMADKAWLLGFLSGTAVTSKKNFIDGTDYESIFLWVDNFCHANPLDTLPQAGILLSKELIKQKKL